MIRLKTLLFEDATKESDPNKKLRVLFVGDSQTAANWSYAKILLRNKLIDGKIVAKTSKYHAHDEKGEYKQGDIIEIVECRPISKTKTWMATRLIEKASAV